MKTIIDVKVSLIRKYGLFHKEANALFELNPSLELLEHCLNDTLQPLFEWLESIADNRNLAEQDRISAACLLNSIEFAKVWENENECGSQFIEESGEDVPQIDEEMDLYDRPKDKEKYSIFKKKKKEIEGYSEDYLIEVMDKYLETRSLEVWNKGKKLRRGIIQQEIYDLLQIYDFYWELNGDIGIRIGNAFSHVWNDLEKKRETFEMAHVDEWFEDYSNWLNKHGLSKCTKSNITEFFKTISESKMKSITIDTIKNKFNS